MPANTRRRGRDGASAVSQRPLTQEGETPREHPPGASLVRRGGVTVADRPREKVSVQIDFSREAYGDLQRLARERETSVSRTIRDALRLENFANETRKKGGRILVKEDGRLSEIVRE